MSLRRISELPNLETFEKQYGSANLSDCIFEVSFTPDNGTTYNSLYLTGKKMEDIIIEHITESTISSLTICGDVDISGGTCRLDNSILELINGSSIIAWPNTKDEVTTKCYLCFNDIRISSNNDINITSDKQLDLYGNPVVINRNLSVYRNSTQTNNVVKLTNTENEIMVQSTPIESLGSHLNRAVNCGMLKNTLDYFQSLVYQYDRGAGVSIDPGVGVTVEASGDGTTDPKGYQQYTKGSQVTLQAIPNGSAVFCRWESSDGQSSNYKIWTFVMPDKSITCTAYFTGQQKQITVTPKITNSGKVTFITEPKNTTVSPSSYTAKKPSSTETFTFTAPNYAPRTIEYTFRYNTEEKIIKHMRTPGWDGSWWQTEQEAATWLQVFLWHKDRYIIKNLRGVSAIPGWREWDDYTRNTSWSISEKEIIKGE